MSILAPAETTVEDILYKRHRAGRELGHLDPVISLERNAMRQLGLLTDESVVDGHQVLTTVFESGYEVADLLVK